MDGWIEFLTHVAKYLGNIERYIWVIAISMALAPIFYRDHKDFTNKQ